MQDYTGREVTPGRLVWTASKAAAQGALVVLAIALLAWIFQRDALMAAVAWLEQAAHALAG